MNKFYITTAIDYTTDVIHIGHGFQKLVADVFARYYRIKLGNDNVFFLTGTDEYGISPKEWVDKIAKDDKKELDSLNISYNRYIRTTDRDHTKVAQALWKKVEANGDIYLGTFTGLYCASCETYYEKADLVDNHCPFHPTLKIEELTEKNFFFRLSKYRDFLLEHIERNPDFALPNVRKNEMLAFLKRGLKDIPISRTSFSWGIPVPNHPDHVMYVWFDALANYLTGVGWIEDKNEFEKFWSPDLQIVGKDNFQKHTILWTAMLKSAGIELQKTVYGHGFLSLNNKKISKTLGNFVRISDWVSKYGTEAVRYYLLRYCTLEEDGNISEEGLANAYKADLANGLGNVVSRITKLCEVNGIVSKRQEYAFNENVSRAIDSFKISKALPLLWEELTKIDQRINNTKVWQLPTEEAEIILTELVGRIQSIAYTLKPFLPETSAKIIKQLSGEIKAVNPLFPRI